MTTGERIAGARKKKGMTQERLAGILEVSPQAVSSWERDEYLPDTKNLTALAEALNVSLDSLFTEREHAWELKPVNYDAGHMYTFVKGRAQMKGMTQTLAVLDMLRAAHGAQERKSRNGFGTTYMVHPLTMACHALAMRIREDDVVAACLAHDMAEDAHMKPEELPVSKRVQTAVRLVSKNMYDPNETDWEDRYYENIRKDPLACMVKCLDRVNNVAGMADFFSRERMAEYTEQTDRYYPALLDVIKKVPEWNDAWWLLRYQMMTMTETFKRLL